MSIELRQRDTTERLLANRLGSEVGKVGIVANVIL